VAAGSGVSGLCLQGSWVVAAPADGAVPALTASCSCKVAAKHDPHEVLSTGAACERLRRACSHL
jgi:hypothetical protein